MLFLLGRGDVNTWYLVYVNTCYEDMLVRVKLYVNT